MAHVTADLIPQTNLQAIFGVQQNTLRLDEQIEFYKGLGCVVDGETCLSERRFQSELIISKTSTN